MSSQTSIPPPLTSDEFNVELMISIKLIRLRRVPTRGSRRKIEISRVIICDKNTTVAAILRFCLSLPLTLYDSLLSLEMQICLPILYFLSISPLALCLSPLRYHIILHRVVTGALGCRVRDFYLINDSGEIVNRELDNMMMKLHWRIDISPSAPELYSRSHFRLRVQF